MVERSIHLYLGPPWTTIDSYSRPSQKCPSERCTYSSGRFLRVALLDIPRNLFRNQPHQSPLHLLWMGMNWVLMRFRRMWPLNPQSNFGFVLDLTKWFCFIRPHSPVFKMRVLMWYFVIDRQSLDCLSRCTPLSYWRKSMGLTSRPWACSLLTRWGAHTLKYLDTEHDQNTWRRCLRFWKKFHRARFALV